MAKRKPSLTDTIKALTKGAAKPAKQIESLNTGPDIKKDKKKKKKDTRGGSRPGAGRKPGGNALQRRLVRLLVQDHYSEQIEVKVKDPKTGTEHTIKKPRVLVAIDTLFQIGIQKRDGLSLDRYLNRALGKAPQPLVGDEDEDAIQMDLGVDRILDKAYGNEDDEE